MKNFKKSMKKPLAILFVFLIIVIATSLSMVSGESNFAGGLKAIGSIILIAGSMAVAIFMGVPLLFKIAFKR